ncbi:prostatic acid phosphatase-like isoform X2, partial [Leptotrombidium deliense]
FNPRALKAQSINVDRCIESALLTAAGTYPPKRQFVWNKEVNFQTFPVHILNDNFKSCKRAIEDTEKYIHSDSVAMKLCDKLNNFMKNHAHAEYTCLDYILLYYNYQCLHSYGYSLPSYLNTTMQNMINKLATKILLIKVKKVECYVENQNLNIINALVQSYIIQKNSTNKVYLWNMHDDTLAPILSLLDVYNGLWLPSVT